MFGFLKRRRRERLRAAPFPPEWEGILRKNVPLYGRLDDADRTELHGHVGVPIAAAQKATLRRPVCWTAARLRWLFGSSNRSTAGRRSLGEVRSEAEIVRHRIQDAHFLRFPTLANLIAVSCRVRFPRHFRGLRPSGAARPPALTACL